MRSISFWPDQAGRYAVEVDWLFFGLALTTGLTFALLLFLMVRFMVEYREGSSTRRGPPDEKSWPWEIGWTSASLVTFVGFAIWGAHLYLRLYQPPADALEIFVVAKQWMWKLQHPGGQREIDELHIPVGRPIRLVTISQDVIHSFYVPAFRIKHDVLPGRYETLWFEAVKTGTYGLLCAEFCGTQHSGMLGRIVVIEPRDYEAWLADQGQPDTLAQAGATLFRSLGCSGCHGAAAGGVSAAGIAGGQVVRTVRAPPLEGLYGRPVPLADGRVATADERYIRDSILLPKQEVAAGYPDAMPSFAGQVGEDELVKLVAYVKSLAAARPPAQTPIASRPEGQP